MTWNEFWQAHGKQNYTPVFNSFLDSQIANVKLPLTLRVLAWVLRNAWGRHSDACIDEAGARRTQVDCARELKVFNRKGEPARNKVNRSLMKLQAWGLVRVVGWDISPIDPEQASSPNVPLLSHPNAPIGEGRAKLSVSDYCENVWKLEKPSTYGEYQKIAPRYKELRTELVSDCKAYNGMSQRDVTNEENGAADVPEGGDNLSPRDATNGAPSFMRTKERFYASATNPSSSFSGTGQPQPTTTAFPPGSQIAQALWEHASISDEALVRQMRWKCREKAPDCTDEEIAHFIRVKGHLARGKPSPGGYLLTAVSNCFEGHSFQQFRAERSRQQAAEQQRLKTEEERQKRQDAEWERQKQEMLAQLADPDFPEEEKRFNRRMLGLEETERKGPASEPGARAQKAGQG